MEAPLAVIHAYDAAQQGKAPMGSKLCVTV